jgi:hypothetical protein
MAMSLKNIPDRLLIKIPALYSIPVSGEIVYEGLMQTQNN